MRPIASLLVIAGAACTSVSTDADAIVFSSGRTGDGDIYVLMPGQAEPELLLGTVHGEGALRFDPVSNRIVHSRFDASGAVLFTGNQRLFRDPNGDVAPVWATSGMIAYVREADGTADLYSAHQDGSGEVRLTNDAQVERYPAWDPQGRRLVYAKQLDTGWDLHVLDLSSGTETRLTHDGVYVGHPSWSPSGEDIAFDRMFGSQAEIVVLRLSDQRMTRITENSGNDLLPSWSSDGSRLVFASEQGGNWDIWTHTIGTGSTERRTDDSAFDGGPIFVPVRHLN